jgi:hypothetical protein
MTCIVSELDYMADQLGTAGQAVLGVPAITASQAAGAKAASTLQSKVVPVLKAETGRLKDMLGCLGTCK